MRLTGTALDFIVGGSVFDCQNPGVTPAFIRCRVDSRINPQSPAPTTMKQFLTILAICCSLSLSPARAETPRAEVTLDSLHKQLITIVETELANNKELDQSHANRLKYMIPVWREAPTRITVQGRLQQLSVYLNQGNVSQKTKDAADACMTQIAEFMEKQSKQMVEDIGKTTSEILRRVLKAHDPEEIRKVISEYKDFRAKVVHGGFRDESSAAADTSSASQFMDYWLSFHNYRTSEQTRYAAGQISQMEALSSRLSTFLTIDEITQALQNLRKSIGMLPPKELEALWQQTFQQMLDDTNQDRLDELLLTVSKTYQITQASNSTEMLAARWQWLESLGRKLKESVQRGKEGLPPGFTTNDLSRSDSSYGVLVKAEDFNARLCKYLIRSRDDKGNDTSVRLFYDDAELKTIVDDLLTRILDDAHQEKLVELQEEIKRLRAYVMSNRYASANNLSAKLDRMSQLARSIRDNVSVLKMGGNNQLGLPQLYNDYSDGVVLLSKEDLLGKLKRYQVNVPATDGTTTKRALYVDAVELLQQVKSAAELPAIVPEMTRASSNVMNESGVYPLAGLMPRIMRCAEIAQQLSTGESFMMQSASSSSYYSGDSSRSTPTSGPMVDRIKQLEAEVEWSVILRFFPAHAGEKVEDHENKIKSLMAKYREQKNYEAMSQLHGVSLYFKPARQLLSQTQAQAVRDYLNGVRQEEVLDQPRLAVFYLQKAAMSPSTVIDGEQLKTRLQMLRKKFSVDYEKGIDDALKTVVNEAVPREIEVPAATK